MFKGGMDGKGRVCIKDVVACDVIDNLATYVCGPRLGLGLGLGLEGRARYEKRWVCYI